MPKQEHLIAIIQALLNDPNIEPHIVDFINEDGLDYLHEIEDKKGSVAAGLLIAIELYLNK